MLIEDRWPFAEDTEVLVIIGWARDVNILERDVEKQIRPSLVYEGGRCHEGDTLI